jgi:hypothetical protein
VHDITDLESRGVPGVFVASSEFVAASEAQAQALGLDAARVFVPHPIQDRTDEEIRALAERVVDEVLAAVTSSTEPRGRP